MSPTKLLQALAVMLRVAVFVWSGHAQAADDVVKDVILLGQTADLSGSRAANTKEFNAGALAYFDGINKKGGIYGRRIQLVSKDDAYVIDRSVANARELIEKDRVFMIFATVGTENFKAVEEKVTTPAKVPLFAPSSGAEVLRAPYKRYVFPVRAGYHAEMEKIIQHLTTVGIHRVAIFYDDDSFGKDILVGVERALGKRNLKIHSQASVDREGKLIGEAVKRIGPSQPEATVVGSAGGTAIKFVREMLKQGYDMPTYMNSGINVGSLTKELGDSARGMAVVQLMPDVNDASIAVAREYKKLAQSVPGKPLTTKGLEGYVAAKILVEGLKRAGKGLTRETFVQALDSLGEIDVGGIPVRYTDKEHTGVTYVDLAVITRGGKTLR